MRNDTITGEIFGAISSDPGNVSGMVPHADRRHVEVTSRRQDALTTEEQANSNKE